DPVQAEITLVVSKRWVSYLPLVVRSSRGTAASTEPPEERARGILVRAPLPGTYTILVADDLNGTRTGSYGLHLQQLNTPDNATPIDFGQTKTGSINQVAEVDAYTFMATGGDVVLVGASHATGDMWPLLRLYDSAGNLVGTSGDSRHTEVQVTVASSGAYTVLVSDDLNGTHSGVYGLYLQRLNNPGNATPVDFGQTLAGSINLVAEMDAYTFAADAGDVVLIGAGRSTGDLWPQIRLFDPEGNLVGVAGESTHAEVQVKLTSSGTHTLLIADDLNGTHTGGYGLHLQRLNNPGNAKTLAYSDQVAATINMVAEVDAYTFSASAGDAIVIGMARTSGSLWPQIRLFDPDGEAAGTADGATSVELNTTLTETGTYTILAADDLNGTLTGGYDLQLQKTTR
ncbi:pre-peptidase C-terminal domain-containing protein, partial [Chloroflexota bacterium]